MISASGRNGDKSEGNVEVKNKTKQVNVGESFCAGVEPGLQSSMAACIIISFAPKMIRFTPEI